MINQIKSSSEDFRSRFGPKYFKNILKHGCHFYKWFPPIKNECQKLSIQLKESAINLINNLDGVLYVQLRTQTLELAF